MSTCPACTKDLGSNWVWSPTKKGKKWLKNTKSGEWHDCPKSTFKGKSNFQERKWIKATAKDHEQCEFCGNWLYTREAHLEHPTWNYISMEDHVKMFHPNGEIMDEIDFKCVSDEEKEEFRRLFNMPKRTEKYQVVKRKPSIVGSII
jgi:hypothetical protein